MNLFGKLRAHDDGELHVYSHSPSGLRAIVAINDTRLGPSLGGCRMISYSDEEAAFTDALRLARGMTRKAAISGLPLGGGKSVILRPDGAFDRNQLFSAFGRFVDSLGGRYITAEDSGTSLDDMEVIRTQTRHVAGTSPARGGSGDPSPFTALGVLRGLEAAVKFKLGRESLEGLRVSVQGVGHVGFYLCELLHKKGAILTVCDTDSVRTNRAKEQFKATVIPTDAIYHSVMDVFAPCALGAVLNDQTIPKLSAKVIAGAANNQLAEPKHAAILLQRGITYAPDYVINAGGLINVAQELKGYDEQIVREKTMKIYDTTLEILQRAEKESRSPAEVADQMALEILQRAG